MDSREALHTFLRRKCTERAEHWRQAYRPYLPDLPDGNSIFPRYLVWEAIRDEVERLVPTSLPSLKSLREELTIAIRRAETVLTSNPALPPVALHSMEEERAYAARLIRTTKESDLAGISPLPFRRVMTREEARGFWHQLEQRWGVQGYWFPLSNPDPPGHILCFHDDWFDQEKRSALYQIQQSLGLHRIFELAWSNGCERALTVLPRYRDEEFYWFPPSLDWIIYVSHESSVTLAGEPLLTLFRERFPDCDDSTYLGEISNPDLRGRW